MFTDRQPITNKRRRSGYRFERMEKRFCWGSRDSQAMEAEPTDTEPSRLETIPAELRVEIYKNLLPTEPVRLDKKSCEFAWRETCKATKLICSLTSTDHFASRNAFLEQLELVMFPNDRLNEEYLHEYFKHTTLPPLPSAKDTTNATWPSKPVCYSSETKA